VILVMMMVVVRMIMMFLAAGDALAFRIMACSQLCMYAFTRTTLDQIERVFDDPSLEKRFQVLLNCLDASRQCRN